jgi:hypothetical protein
MLLALQRHAGNRAVSRLIAGRGKLNRSLARTPTQRKPTTKTIGFRLRVTRSMTAAEVLDEFIRQYYGATTNAEIAGKRGLWQMPSRGTTDKEVKDGFVDMDVTLENQTALAALDPERQKQVNAETDKRFWAATGLPEGSKIKPGDKEMAKLWAGMRNAVLTEDKQRAEIAALPEDIKRVLFAGGKDATAVSPDDYTRSLQIAHKLAQLTPEERQDYLARVTGSTTSLDALDASIDQYIQFRQQRAQQESANETSAAPLFGGENVYDLYRAWKLAMATTWRKSGVYGKGGPPVDYELTERKRQEALTQLLAALRLKDFDSVAEFETAIEAYRLSFRTQAVNLALDLLTRFEHKLFEARNKLAAGGGATIAAGIAATQAAVLYQRAHDEEAASIRAMGTKDYVSDDQIKRSIEHASAAVKARNEAERQVLQGSGNDWLVAERGIDREKLAGLDADGVRDYLNGEIDKRYADIAKARQEFHEDPDRVFRLPDLVAAEMQVQGVDASSIYAHIVNDFISAEQTKHMLSAIAIGILALALAVLVPGGGWVAAAALVGSAAISSYQAYEAVKEYSEQESDYRLHFLEQEPSLFWVGVAIVAAAADVGIAAGVLIKESAAALKALEGPLEEFSKGGELEELLKQIDTVEGLRPEARRALAAGAEQANAARAAWHEALSATGTAGMFGGDVGGVTSAGLRALYLSVKRGVNTLAGLQKEAKYLGIMKEVTGLTGVERAELEAAFDEVKTLVHTGQRRGMDDATMLEYFDRWAANRVNTTARTKILDEMRGWKPLTAEQKRALSTLTDRKSLVAQLYEEKADLLSERAQLRAQQANPATRSDANRARLLEINEELRKLDPSLVEKPGSTARQGDISRAEEALAKAEEAARQSQITLYDRIRAATPSDAARERALKTWAAERQAKGIAGPEFDQVGKLKTAPTGKLAADHIVPVREIVEMDGFKDLTLQQQKAIVDMKENLIAMDSAANSSKGDISWRFWRNASSYYDSATIDAMKLREVGVRKLVEDAIAKAKVGAAK